MSDVEWIPWKQSVDERILDLDRRIAKLEEAGLNKILKRIKANREENIRLREILESLERRLNAVHAALPVVMQKENKNPAGHG